MQLFVDYDVSVATDGVQAAEHANAVRPDCVIMEVSLAQHSGIEFLYEFRSYVDWQSIPVVVFTSLQIPQTVLRSVSWGLLDIEYAYKPHTSLDQLSTLVQGLVSDTQYISSEVAG